MAMRPWIPMDNLAQWVPSSVLVAAAIAFATLALRLLRHHAEEVLRRLVAIEADIQLLSSQFPKLATLEQLTNLGNRFNERIEGNRKDSDEKIADLRERVRVLESYK